MRRWLVAASVAGVVVAASLAPLGGGTATFVSGVDEGLHAVGYAAVAVTVAWASRGDDRSRRRRAVLAFLVAISLGLLVELAQGTVATRHTSATDAIANGVGALLGTVGWWVGSRTRWWKRRFDGD